MRALAVVLASAAVVFAVAFPVEPPSARVLEGTGPAARAASSVSQRSAAPSGSYWVGYWRRRYLAEHRSNVAHAGMVRRLRAEVRRLRARRFVVPEPWRSLAACESGGRWDYNGDSGFDGGLQHHPSTWSAYRLPGYPPFAYLATPEQQVTVARRVLAAQGWGAWPACSRKLGLR